MIDYDVLEVQVASADIILDRIKRGKVAVLGFGVSNKPLTEFLLNMGADITVHDKKDKREISESAELERRGVRFVTGEGYLDSIDADVVFRSPGIRPDNRAIADAVAGGAILTSEMELFLELTPASVIGVTGSDGKTTTTTLIYKIIAAELEKSGRRVFVGGNIGTPLLDKASEMTDKDVAVLELSSFQLFTMRRSPSRAVITNVSPNHLDWHRDMSEYTEAKVGIFKHGAERLSINGANDICVEAAKGADVPVEVFSARLSLDELKQKNPTATAFYYLVGNMICRCAADGERELLDRRDILIPGDHNVENYMAAISATWGYVSLDSVALVAKSFCGVEHRLELVRELDGVRYYNSSIDSSPTRTAAALSALSSKPIVICGGYDKNIPFAPLAKALCERAKAVVLTGATGEKIYQALLDEPSFSPEKLTVKRERDFTKAVLLAKSMAKEGDIVLLSPACASFDAFANFAERGNYFKKIVKGF